MVIYRCSRLILNKNQESPHSSALCIIVPQVVCISPLTADLCTCLGFTMMHDDTEWGLEGDFSRNAFDFIIDDEQY